MIKDIKIFTSLLSIKDKQKIVRVFLIVMALTLIELIGFSAIIPLVSFVINEEFIQIFQRSLDIKLIYNLTNNQILNLFLISTGFIFLIKFILESFFIKKKNEFFFEIMKNFSASLFKNYIHRPYPYFLKKNTSDIISNISVLGPEVIYNYFIPLINLFVDLFLIISIICVLAFIDFKIIIIFSFFFLVSLIIYSYLKKKLKKFGIARAESEKLKILYIQKSFNGIKENIIFDRLNFFEQKFLSILEKIKNIFSKYYTFLELPKPIIETSAIFLLLAIIYLLKLFGTEDQNLAIIITAVGVSSYKLMPCINRIVHNLQRIKFSSPLIVKLANEINEISSDQNSTKPVKYDKLNFNSSIKLTNIDFKYSEKNNNYIFKDLNFEIVKNDCIGIFGPSGSGKSTFVNLILGLLRPTNGSIAVDDVDISSNLKAWHKNIGYVPQNITLLDETLIENIVMGSFHNEKFAKDILKISQLENISSLSENTIIGENGSRISGGQRQRIGIARALYKKANFLIFDEATVALDRHVEKKIMEFISSLSKTKTIIIITHNLKILSICNKIYELKDGILSKAKIN